MLNPHVRVGNCAEEVAGRWPTVLPPRDWETAKAGVPESFIAGRALRNVEILILVI